MSGPQSPADLQTRIREEFPIAAHMGIVVVAASEESLVLRAPLAANANHQGTAFGGSLFSLAALAGWAWLTRFVARQALDANAVIQDGRIDYLLPVHGAFTATLAPPSAADVGRFRAMLRRAARGRIRLHVELHDDARLAARFEGVFAAALRPGSRYISVNPDSARNPP
jgi:thioesterase domain-containing protein